MFPVGSIEYLFRSGLKEIFWFLAVYGLILFCATMAQKLSFIKSIICALILMMGTVFFIPAYGATLELAVSILSALLCVAVLYCIGMPKLNILDSLFLFSLFLTPKRFFNSTNSLFGTGVHFLYILMVVLGYGRVKSKTWKGSFLQYYVSFIYLSLVSYLFDFTSVRICSFYRETLYSSSYVPLSAIPFLFILLCVLTVFLCKKLDTQKRELQILGMRYVEIEKYLYLFTGFTVIVLLISHIPFVLTRTSSSMLLSVLSVFYIILLLFQILVLVLFYRLAYYRNALNFKEQEQKNEENYYLALQKNLDSMADIRHDIKNLFLTMGNFVERSADEEMKVFYKDKIFPFAMEEIEKNYMFSQLYQISNDTLRAFLHMKLFQAQNRHENIRLKVQIDHSCFFLGMDIIDLTRILGILLDNAFEECCAAPDSYIEIHIKNRPSLCTYVIKNTIHFSHSEQDGLRGHSTKIGHSGLGLSIVKSIVTLYPNVDLNTFFDKNFYLQSLNIHKDV